MADEVVAAPDAGADVGADGDGAEDVSAETVDTAQDATLEAAGESQDDSGDGEVVPKAPAKAKAPEAPREPETFEVVVNGKAMRLTKEQLILRAQKGEAAEKRIQSAVEQERKAMALLKELETDPEAALARMGKDPSKIISDHLARKAAQDMLTPEQRERQKLEEELSQFKSKEKEAAEAATRAEEEQRDAVSVKRVEATLLRAATNQGLEGNLETLDMMYDVVSECLELGIEPDPEAVVRDVIERQRMHTEARERRILSKIKDDPAKLTAWLAELGGPDIVQRLVKHSLTAVPKPGSKPRAVTRAPEPVDDRPRKTSPSALYDILYGK